MTLNEEEYETQRRRLYELLDRLYLEADSHKFKQLGHTLISASMQFGRALEENGRK